MSKLNYSETDKILSNINAEINFFNYIMPINFKEENIKFKELYIKKNIYNPQYVYRGMNKETINKIQHNLNKLSFDNNTKGNIYLNSIESIDNDLKLLQSIGNAKMFTKLGKVRCGEPNRKYLDRAKECLKLEDTTDLKEHSVEDLKMNLEKCINFYSFKWDVKVSYNMPSKVRVDTKNKTVLVNGNEKYSRKDIERLCVHEISTHVLRAENGALREHNIFKFGTSNSGITEEGLALYNEELAGLSNISIHKLYAARFLSSINMDTMSFYDMVREIEPFIGLDNAIYVVARFKIGLKDTSEFGGYINDYIYYQGYEDVKNAISGDSGLYKKLYFGSIGLKDVDLLDKEINEAIISNNIILPNLAIH